MAHIYQKPVLLTLETGQRVAARDKYGREVMRPYWYARIVLHDGKRKEVKFSGLSENEVRKKVERLEGRQADIKAGLIAAPTPADKTKVRAVADVMKEYLDSGNLNGGRGGRPWSKHNARKRKYYLDWWKKELRLDTMNDMKDCLARAEGTLKKLKDCGKSEKTLALYREGLFVFAAWCEDREYLGKNPFAKMPRFSNKPNPKNQRRDMKEDEINKLLDSVPRYRRMLYETAFATGFRAGELRSLQAENLLVESSCIYLSADADKARKERYQPVDPDFLKRLGEYGATGEAVAQYRKMFIKAGQEVGEDIPAKPLLYVPSQPGRTIKADLKKAGIPIRSASGRLDFHACRVAYINMVIRFGADIKTAQTLARHSTPDMTFNTYGRENEELMAAAAGKVCAVITRQNPDKADCHSSTTPELTDTGTPFELAGYGISSDSSIPPAGTIFI